MLSRLLPKPSHFRLLNYLSSKSQQRHQTHTSSAILRFSRFLSTNRNNNDGGNSNSNNRDQSTSNTWNLSRESEGKFDKLFTATDAGSGDVVEDVFGKSGSGTGGDEWVAAGSEEYKPWSVVDEVKDDVFDIDKGVRTEGESLGEIGTNVESERSEEEQKRLEMEEKELSVVLKGNVFCFLYFLHNLVARQLAM